MEVLENPTLRKLSNEKKEELSSLITRYVKRVVLSIKAHCNRDDLPEALEDVAVMMAEDMLKADGVIEVEKEISSVSRGDTNISYRDPSSAYQKSVNFVKNYECQLVHFKRLKLPKDGNDRS